MSKLSKTDNVVTPIGPKMEEEPYPYNQPPWRRSYQATSPDGRWCAKITYASEIFMSGPTKGTLSISDLFAIPDCNPAFIWSDDSRYIAVPQWKYFLRRRERLLVVDTQTQTILASPSRFRLLELRSFSGGVIAGIDSPIWRPREIEIPLAEVIMKYRTIQIASDSGT